MNDITPLGEPGDNSCTVCEGSIIVAPVDSFDYAYDVSHEIAEYRCGFKHSSSPNSYKCKNIEIIQVYDVAFWDQK